MTTKLTAVFDQKGALHVTETDKLQQWRNAHPAGQVFELYMADNSSSALTTLARRYFATRDEYAAVNGYANEELARLVAGSQELLREAST